jgi:hypothetical protein
LARARFLAVLGAVAKVPRRREGVASFMRRSLAVVIAGDRTLRLKGAAPDALDV